MSTLEYIDTLNIPVWALPYLVNGDASSLDDEDEQDCIDWLNEAFPQHDCLTFNVHGAPHFCYRPAFGLAAECVDVEVHGHPTEYEYFINLDERGEFSADVRTPGGRTIFEIAGTDFFECGWMKHKGDLSGLESYLRHVAGAIPKSATVTKGQ